MEKRTILIFIVGITTNFFIAAGDFSDSFELPDPLLYEYDNDYTRNGNDYYDTMRQDELREEVGEERTAALDRSRTATTQHKGGSFSQEPLVVHYSNSDQREEPQDYSPFTDPLLDELYIRQQEQPILGRTTIHTLDGEPHEQVQAKERAYAQRVVMLECRDLVSESFDNLEMLDPQGYEDEKLRYALVQTKIDTQTAAVPTSYDTGAVQDLREVMQGIQSSLEGKMAKKSLALDRVLFRGLVLEPLTTAVRKLSHLRIVLSAMQGNPTGISKKKKRLTDPRDDLKPKDHIKAKGDAPDQTLPNQDSLSAF